MNTYNNNNTVMIDGEIHNFTLLRSLNANGKYEYTVNGFLSFPHNGITASAVTVESSPTPNTIELVFNVTDSGQVGSYGEFLIPFAKRLGTLDYLSDLTGVIELYLIVHESSNDPNLAPPKKPKGKVVTGSARPEM